MLTFLQIAYYLVMDRPLCFCPVVTSSIFYLLFSSPNLNGHRLDVYHTAVRPHMQDAKCRQKFAICAPSHNFVGHIFAINARINNQKKLLNSNVSSTCLHNMVNFG